MEMNEKLNKTIATPTVPSVNTPQKIDVGGRYKAVRSETLQVGDIVRIQDGDRFPADLLLITITYLFTRRLSTQGNVSLSSLFFFVFIDDKYFSKLIFSTMTAEKNEAIKEKG